MSFALCTLVGFQFAPRDSGSELRAVSQEASTKPPRSPRTRTDDRRPYQRGAHPRPLGQEILRVVASILTGTVTASLIEAAARVAYTRGRTASPRLCC